MKKLINIILAVLTIIAMRVANSATLKPERALLTASNTLIFNSQIDGVSVDNFVSSLIGKSLLLGDDYIYVIIVSPGGEYRASLALREAIELHPKIKLICKYCASAAGMLFATSSHKRLILNNSVLLMHEMYVPHVTANMINNELIREVFTRDSENFNKLMYTKFKMTKEQYDAKITNTDWEVVGRDILKIHGADNFVSILCDRYIYSLAPRTCQP